MKLNIKNLVFLVTTVAVTGISCKKQDFNNTQPDSITGTTVDYRTVLPASLASTATVIDGGNWKFLQNWMGYWARSGSFQDITDEESYVFDNDFNVGVWNSLYANATNYNFIVLKAQAAGAPFYEGIARIMKSLDFQMLVDIYGNVPYSKAFQGAEGRTPAYDKGQDIYDSLFVDIDRAIALIKDANTTIDNNPEIFKNDYLYGAADLAHYDIDHAKLMWTKLANTIKLRMIIHASQAPGFDAAGKMTVITNEGSGFLGAGETAKINPGYSPSKPSPYWRAYVLSEAGTSTALGPLERANAYSVGPNPADPSGLGYYQYNGDPRLDQFYNPPSGGPQKGIQYGLPAPPPSQNLSGDKLSTVDGFAYSPAGASSDAWIFTDFESLFLQAEAANRTLLAGDPQTILESAMDQSFIATGLTAADASGYRTTNAGYPDVDYSATGGGLFTILSQKWFALNGFSTLEVWTDWRRTDVVYGAPVGYQPGPPVSINPAVPAGRGIPIRLYYPQNEYNYNAANVSAQGTIDVTSAATTLTGRIFWDIN